MANNPVEIAVFRSNDFYAQDVQYTLRDSNSRLQDHLRAQEKCQNVRVPFIIIHFRNKHSPGYSYEKQDAGARNTVVDLKLGTSMPMVLGSNLTQTELVSAVVNS